MNPTVEEVYPILTDILTEIKSVFKDDYIHLGNDEVYYACWESNPNITEWMKKNNFNLTKDVEQYFMERTLGIANKVFIGVKK